MKHRDEVIRVLNKSNLINTINNIITSSHEENPFYVCDLNDIVQKYMMWNIAMPRIKPHYAVKCNDHPTVLKTLAALGLGFDCASKTEMDKVLALGVDPSRIIYAHPTKSASHIRHAANVNVDLTTFDSEAELYKIKRLFPSARTIIRIKYDAKNAGILLGLKYGCDANTESPYLLKAAQALGVNVVGVSFHVGSGCRDPSAFHGAIGAARHVFDVAAKLGYNFNILNIGGGFPGELNNSIYQYGNIINAALRQYFPSETVRIISEPGTFFVESAFTLVCNVHSSKKLVTDNPDESSSSHFVYYINDGVFGNLSSITYCNTVKIPVPLKAYPNAKEYPSTVWGPTCDSIDQIISNIMLPELQLGDWLFFTDMGAYTLTLSTSFNSFESPTMYNIINIKNWLLLRENLPFAKEDFIYDVEDTTSNKSMEEDQYVIPKSSFIKG